MEIKEKLKEFVFGMPSKSSKFNCTSWDVYLMYVVGASLMISEFLWQKISILILLLIGMFLSDVAKRTRLLYVRDLAIK